MDGQIANLVAFAHTVREGSLSAAAERLGITQSAVSQRLQKLEAAVGTKLHVRDRDGLVLTPSGKEIFALADRQADLSQLISETIRGYSEAEDGQLSVIANAPLPALRMIAAFGAAKPKVRLSFTLYDWTSAVELLKERKVDVAVMTDLTPSAYWTTWPLGDVRYGAYIPERHPLAVQPSVSLHDLAAETVILPEPGSLTERVAGQVFSDAGLEPRRILRLTTFPLMKEAVLQGVGIGIFLEQDGGRTDGMVWRPIAEIAQRFGVCVATPRGKESLRLVKAFLEAAEVR